MRQIFQSLWWWVRIIVLAAVGLYVLALLWKNSSQRASIWYWPGSPAEETNIMVLALAAFVSGGLMWALASALVNLRRTRAARKKRALELQREEIERKASMLRVKPAPQPIVRPKPEPIVETKPLSKPATEPVPVVEPTPEVTLAPSPVVMVKPAAEKSIASGPEVITADVGNKTPPQQVEPLPIAGESSPACGVAAPDSTKPAAPATPISPAPHAT